MKKYTIQLQNESTQFSAILRTLHFTSFVIAIKLIKTRCPYNQQGEAANPTGLTVGTRCPGSWHLHPLTISAVIPYPMAGRPMGTSCLPKAHEERGKAGKPRYLKQASTLHPATSEEESTCLRISRHHYPSNLVSIHRAHRQAICDARHKCEGNLVW